MMKGMDISKWQGAVDFAKVAASGIQFAILREGYRQAVDGKFFEYVNGCRANNIPVKGVYHFSYALNADQARNEAAFCIAQVEKAGLGKDTVIFYDFEYDTVKQAKEKGVVIAFPVVFAYCAKLCRQEGVRRQKEKLNEEFMNVLKVLSSNMLAGYSVENAWQEAEKEMELMYGNDSLMLSEIQEMNRQIKMNQTFEAVLSEFAHRSGLEDIVNFSDIFSFAKRSGGRFVDIIESTTYRMWTKYDTNRQIEVAVSAKRLEQKTMNYIPIFLLAFLKLSSRDYMSALYGNLIGVIFMSTCLLAYAGAIKLAKKFLQVGIGI